MTVFEAVSFVNVIASAAGLILAAVVLARTENHLLRQVLVTPVFLLLGLLVMHIYELVRGSDHSLQDLGAIAWRFLDFLTLVVIARLVGAIPK